MLEVLQSQAWPLPPHTCPSQQQAAVHTNISIAAFLQADAHSPPRRRPVRTTLGTLPVPQGNKRQGKEAWFSMKCRSGPASNLRTLPKTGAAVCRGGAVVQGGVGDMSSFAFECQDTPCPSLRRARRMEVCTFMAERELKSSGAYRAFLERKAAEGKAGVPTAGEPHVRERFAWDAPRADAPGGISAWRKTHACGDRRQHPGASGAACHTSNPRCPPPLADCVWCGAGKRLASNARTMTVIATIAVAALIVCLLGQNPGAASASPVAESRRAPSKGLASPVGRVANSPEAESVVQAAVSPARLDNPQIPAEPWPVLPEAAATAPVSVPIATSLPALGTARSQWIAVPPVAC